MKRLFSIIIMGTAFFASCANTSKLAGARRESVSVEFVGEATIKKAEGRISLYAVAENIADVPATLIMVKKIEQSKLPFTISFELPDNYKQLIKPTVREGDLIKYYVTMDWDSNNDGKVGIGDVMIDYDKRFPYVKVGQMNQIFVDESK